MYGVKGLEFERVMAVSDDENTSGRFLYKNSVFSECVVGQFYIKD